jgi:hypothetical protein
MILSQGQDAVRPQLAQFLQRLRVAAGCHHSPRAQPLRHLYRQLPGHAGRSKNQDAFPRRQLRALGERPPRRHPRIHHGGHRRIAQWFGNREAGHPPSHASLRKAPVDRLGAGKVHALAIGQMANAVEARDERQFTRAAVMSARGQRLHNGVQARGGHGEQNFFSGRYRFCKRFVAGRSGKGMDDGSVHGSPQVF